MYDKGKFKCFQDSFIVTFIQQIYKNTSVKMLEM